MADTPSTPATPASTPTSPASTPPSSPANPSSPASTPIPTDSTSTDPKIPPTPDTTPPPTPKTTRDTPSTTCTPKSTPVQLTPDQASTPGSPQSLTPASMSGTGTPTPASPTPLSPSPRYPTPDSPSPRSPTPHSPSPPSPTPKFPTPRPPTPRSPTAAVSSLSHPPLAATHSFKSSLQILLKKQDDELDRNREYKKAEEVKEEEEKEKGEEKEKEKRKTNNEEDREEPEKEERSKEERATRKDKKGEDKEDKQHHKKKEASRKEIDVAKDDKKEGKERSGKGEETGKGDKKKKSLVNETENEEEKGKSPKRGTREKAKARQGDQKKSEGTKEVKKERGKPEGNQDRSEDKRKIDKDRRGEAKAQEKLSESKTKERSKRKEREKEDGEVEAKKSKPEGKNTTEEERGKNTEKTTKKEGKSMRWRDEEGGTMGEKAQGVLYIKKREKPFSRWKRYYFVLDGKLLTYYRSEQDYQNLSGVKGSLDLAMLEQVAEKQPGLLRSNYPFNIRRRSLPSVSLAAETKEERERWMEVMYELLQRLLHLTDHSISEPTRRTAQANTSKTGQKQAKYSTLPNPQKSPSSPSISTSEDEDELKLKKEEEKEGKKEEEPQLIMPKKIPRVPMGLPMGPLKLDGVKLKKIELPIKKESPKEEGENGKIKASEKDKDDRGEEEDTENRKSSAEEMFGVKLKNISPEQKRENNDDKTKEAAGEGIKERGEGKKEGKEDFTSVNLKRPTKQPVIPLNTTGLLARPELQSPKVSPGSQKRGTTERKKSPSPTIPISKSVQALTKSAEEVKAANKDTLSDATSTENGSNLKRKVITPDQTERKEIKYPDVVNLDDNQETVASLKDEDEAVLNNLENSKESKKAKEEEEEVSKKNTSLPIPEVSVVLKSGSEDQTESEKCSSGKEIHDTESHEVKTSDTPPSPTLSSSMGRTNASTSHASPDSPILPIPRNIPAKTSAMKCDSDSQDNEKLDGITTQNTKAASTKKEKSPVPPDSSPTRRRNNTNDSSCSSQLSDTDGTERKQGKFKLFKIKRSSSSVSKERKEDGEEKELKDRKRRGSNAFSKFLTGKKSKNKSGKSNEEETEVQSEETKVQSEETVENSESQEQGRPTQVPAIEVSMATILAMSEERTNEAREKERQDQILSQTGKELSEVNKEHLTSTSTEDLVKWRERSQSREALRGSNYSSSSREQEPAPSLPEKTRIRAISPNHDIPQSNRPVANMYDTHGDQNTEEEARQPLDGYISEKQIHDILSATDREKRKMSQGRLQGPLLSVPNGGGAAGTRQTWADDSSSKRPSYISLTSTESDDLLPITNFLGCERNSSSSGSLKARDSDSSGCEEPEPARKPSRPTDSLTAGKRVSLTLPEFTVVEEDGLVSPDMAKTRLPSDTNVESEKKRKEEDETNGKQQQEHKDKQDTVDESQDKTTNEKEKEEQGDYFPVVGRRDGEGKGEVELRLFHTPQAPPMRTSGITDLQQYLKEEEGEAGEIRSCISRLGHSAAVEKLKQTAEDL